MFDPGKAVKKQLYIKNSVFRVVDRNTGQCLDTITAANKTEAFRKYLSRAPNHVRHVVTILRQK